MAPVVRNFFEIRTQSYFDANIVSLGTLPTICEVLQKYDLFNYFDTWFSDSVFPTYLSWKAIVKTKIREFEENAWIDFVQNIQVLSLPEHAWIMYLLTSSGPYLTSILTLSSPRSY